MCLNWLESNQSLQWLGLAFNTFVHVIMSDSSRYCLSLCSCNCARHSHGACIVLTHTFRYAYYAFTVYKPAPKPLKKLITQVKHNARARS